MITHVCKSHPIMINDWVATTSSAPSIALPSDRGCGGAVVPRLAARQSHQQRKRRTLHPHPGNFCHPRNGGPQRHRGGVPASRAGPLPPTLRPDGGWGCRPGLQWVVGWVAAPLLGAAGSIPTTHPAARARLQWSPPQGFTGSPAASTCFGSGFLSHANVRSPLYPAQILKEPQR